MTPLRVLPVRLDGLSFGLPPGEYLLPWWWSDAQRARMAEILAQGLDGVSRVLEVPWASLSTFAERAATSCAHLLLVTRVPAGTSDRELARVSASLRTVPFRLIQHEDPQPEGYGWQERHLKAPFVHWLSAHLRDPGHPLAPWGAADLDVAEVAGLCTTILEIIELVEATLGEELVLANSLRHPQRRDGFDDEADLGAGIALLASRVAELGPDRSGPADPAARARARMARRVLHIAGRRLGETLASISDDAAARQAVALLDGPEAGGVTSEQLAGARALEAVGLARTQGASIVLGPLARRARSPGVWGGLISPLAKRGLPYPAPPVRTEASTTQQYPLMEAAFRRLDRCVVLPPVKVFPHGPDLAGWIHELARLTEETHELLDQACQDLQDLCEVLEASESAPDDLYTRCVGHVRLLIAALEGRAREDLPTMRALAGCLTLATTAVAQDGAPDNLARLTALTHVLKSTLGAPRGEAKDAAMKVSLCAQMLYFTDATLFVEDVYIPGNEWWRDWIFFDEAGARLYGRWLSTIGSLLVRPLNRRLRDKIGGVIGSAPTIVALTDSYLQLAPDSAARAEFRDGQVVLFEALLRAGLWNDAQRCSAVLHETALGPPTPMQARALMLLALYLGHLGVIDEARHHVACLRRDHPRFGAYVDYLDGWLWLTDQRPDLALAPLSSSAITAARSGWGELQQLAMVYASCSLMLNGEGDAGWNVLAASVTASSDLHRTDSVTPLLVAAIATHQGAYRDALLCAARSWRWATLRDDDDLSVQHAILTQARSALDETTFQSVLTEAVGDQRDALLAFLDAPAPPEPPAPPRPTPGDYSLS